MNERRVSLGNRALSLLLALVMVIGMLPLSVFSVFAAETTTDVSVTQQNIAKIENYAQNMLKNNFTVYGDVDWATEGNDVWKYFNGVMLRAFLMMGVNSDNDVTNSTGNALEYVSGYLDSSITEGTAKPSGYKDTELDSVPPARMLFFLLDSSVDADKYEASIHYVYNCLNTIATGHPYPYNGGNLLHKPGWEGDWEIGLDGIYMAQPFLLEYANAVENEDIDNKYNIDPAALRTQVYTRLIWVADNMATKVDTVNGVDYYLYNHGCKAKDKESDTLQLNGQYWSRGIGWYAAGLVDCIELMPAGTQKNDLIARLPKLFDGMIHYQDTTGGKIDSGNNTGMWYNLVNGVEYTGTSGSKTSNELETSGTALMAYSLLKAYNNDWVTADTYKNAGLRAFNGIVNNKVTGSENSYVVGGIYKQSGVSSTASDYGQYSYVNHEAKGTGPVIMAAVEASRAIGTAEKDVIGVVSAPGGMTVPVGAAAADLDYSNVKLTVVSNFGNVETNIAPYVSQVSISDTSSVGTATVTLYSKQDADLVLDTFTVKVVDPSDPITAEGAITVTGEVSNSNKYVQVTALSIGKNYIFSKTTTGNTVDAAGASSSGGLTGWKVAGNSSASNGVYTLTASSGTLCHWHIDKNNRIYTVISGKNYYVKVTGTGASDRELTDVETDGTVFTMSSNSNKVLATDKVNNRNLVVDSAGLKTGSNSTSNGIFAYEQQTTGTSTLPVILSVQPNTVNLDANGTYDLTTTVTVGGNAVSLSDCTVSWGTSASGVATVSGGKITGVADGSATITATLTAVKINGESKNLDKAISVNIAVNVGDGTATEPVTYTAKFYYGDGTELTSATTLNVKVGETLKLYIKVTDSNGSDVTSSWINGWKANNASVADIVDASGNSVTSGAVVYLKGVAAGNTGINVQTAQDAAGTNKSELYVPVTVQADETEVTYSYTLANISDATIDVGGSVAPNFSVTSGGQDVTANFAMSLSSNNTDVAAIEGNKVVGKSAGTATITVTVAKAVSTLAVETTNETYTTTFNVTVNAASEEPSANGFILDTTGNVDWDKGEYLIVGKSGDKYYALAAGEATAHEVTVKDGAVQLSYADATKYIWIFDNTNDKGYIYNNAGTASTEDDEYLKNGSPVSGGTSGDTGNVVGTVSKNDGTYYIFLEGSTSRYLRFVSASDGWTRSDNGDTVYSVYLYKWTSTESGEGGETVVPSSLSVTSDRTITVANGGTLDLGGVTATVTMSDGTTKDATGLTFEHSVNTSAAGDYTVTVKYTENGVTVTDTITVTVETASGSDTPAENEYVIADAMVDGKQYILGNNQKPERAAYWDGDSWATGTISRTEVNGKENTYTIESTTGFTLFTWESTGTNTGRFYSYVNGTKMYLNDSCKLEATSTSDATVFTVDLSAGTVKGDNNQWLKVDSSALAFKTKEADGATMQLLTPTSTSGGTTDPDTPSTGNIYIHNFSTDKDGMTDVDGYFDISGETASTDVTINGVEYDQGLKFQDGKGQVTFTAAKAGTLTLHLRTDKATKVKINGTEYTATNGVITAELTAGTYTISRADSEAHLYYIEYAENGSSGGTTDPDDPTPDTPSTDGTRYELVDSITSGEEYVIVVITGDGTGVALLNPTGIEADAAGEAQTVTVAADKSYITVSSNQDRIVWTFTLNSSSNFFKQYKITNNGNGIKHSSSTIIKYNSTGSNIRVAKSGDAFILAQDMAEGDSGITSIENRYYYNGDTWVGNASSEDAVVYLYKEVEILSGITLDTLPLLELGGIFQADLSDYVSSVMYNGTTYEKGNYVIEWSVVSGSSVSVDGTTVSGAAEGTSVLQAKLVSVGSGDSLITVSEDITATGSITVVAPSVSIGEDLIKYVGDDAFTIVPEVALGSNVITNYTLEWSSSDESVATVVDGVVTIHKAGTTNITAVLTGTNGNTFGNIGFEDTMTLQVDPVEVVSAQLSSSVVSIAVGSDAAAVKDALSGITLTMVLNNGDVIYVPNASLFNYDSISVDTSATGTQEIAVTYTEPTTGYVYNGTVEVVIYDPNQLDKEGFITIETNVTYEIDTDGIDKDEEYVIVVQGSDGKWYALMNPDATGTGSTKGSSQEVTRIEDGDKITISENVNLVLWKFYNKSSSTKGDYTYATYNVSNNKRYLKGGGDSPLRKEAATVYTWQSGKQYFIGLDVSSNKIKPVIRESDGDWVRYGTGYYPDDDAAKNYYVYLYKKVGTGEEYSVGFSVSPTSLNLVQGATYSYTSKDLSVQVGDTFANDYVVEWKSSNEDVATVDSNGVVTAVGGGDCTITATLVKANGEDVYSLSTNSIGIAKEIKVSVVQDTPTYTLLPKTLTVPLGGEPDFSKVSLLIESSISDTYDRVIPHDQLVIKYIDQVADGFKTDVAGNTCDVEVLYNGVSQGTVKLVVADNPYDGLDEADSYPEYPDPGAVRMDKFATGINFTQTGVAKIELNAAGVTTQSAVDVILIVDVSNSMGWSMDWFSGLTDEQAKSKQDGDKYDTSKDDKLDYAMTAAQNFAEILMKNNVEDTTPNDGIAQDRYNNTITFVTFAGEDEQRGSASGGDIDSVMTPFIAIDDLQLVKNSFANTKFTSITGTGSKVTYKLQVAGTDGEAIVAGTNRGNTNYDFAFLEAIDAVEKMKIQQAGSVEAYDKSGREVHVIFMTDGAPSHYNDKRYDNSSDEGDRFSSFSGDDADWLAAIQNPNTDATNLYSMIKDFHIVGYDLNHGGFRTHSWTETELGRVLGGLVQNKALDYTLATDTDKLNTFFNDLAHTLAYAGTQALVTDIVSEQFILQTDPIDLDGTGPNEETLNPEIQIISRRLVVQSDIGSKLVINGVETQITEEHLGMRVDGGETVLATVTFDVSDKTNPKAFSDALGDGVDIWEGDNKTGTITGKYFTYNFFEKKFEWKIGDITDHEIALTYYGFLTGTQDSNRDAGVYATNASATLKYIDTNNEIVVREYPVPKMAWGSATVEVRFFLVNEDGEFTNLAGNTFTNPANRIFLTNRAYYDYELNEVGATNPDNFTVVDAFAEAKISNQYALYDDTVTVYVLNSTADNGGRAYKEFTSTGKKTDDLVTFDDLSGNSKYLQTIVYVPVVQTGRGQTQSPLSGETAVLDYAKPISIDLFNANELMITQHDYTIELYGLASYNPAFDTSYYLIPAEYNGFELDKDEPYDAGFGTFKITDKATGTIEFTPNSICGGPVQIFAIAKITSTLNTNNCYYLYNPVTIVPATTVYYETDFVASGVFSFTGIWNYVDDGTTVVANQDKDPDVNRKDSGHTVDHYGSDSSYNNGNLLSAGKSWKATGAGVDNTTVSFTFTGTGFDIISRTGAAQGMIRVTVTNSDGEDVKTVRVTNQGTNELYQIPVVSVEGLEHGTYTVTIGVYTATNYPAGFEHLNRGNEFHFDAVRIYNTAKGNEIAETEYKLDGEFAPNIQEVRNLLITKEEFTAASGKTGAVWLDPYGKGATVDTTNVVGTYKAQGPNNEVYLAYGQGIAFVIESGTVPATVQIGAKSINGSSATLNAYIGDANSTASATLTKNIATATDMYYELSGDYAALFADGKTYVVVWNAAENTILSITDIKVAYTTDPAETLVVSYSEEMATFASNLLVTAVEQDDPDMTVAKGEDGNYYYYVADRVNEAYTGLVELDNGTWYVQDGQIVFNFDGAITFQGETYYIKAGRVSETTTGLYKYTGDWMYYTSGKVDTAYTGLAERSGMTVYVANGAVDFTKTGAVSHNGKLYYVRYGVVDSSFTGLVRADDGAWVYVTAGQQDTAYTGIVAHNGSNWYVENGTVNFQFTGTVADANGNWTVNRGQATAVNN